MEFFWLLVSLMKREIDWKSIRSTQPTGLPLGRLHQSMVRDYLIDAANYKKMIRMERQYDSMYFIPIAVIYGEQSMSFMCQLNI